MRSATPRHGRVGPESDSSRRERSLMGMFKDLRNLTKQANELKRNSNTPGMGDMIKQANQQMSQLNEMQQGTPELIQNGEAGTGIVKGMGTPARGASWFNMDIDLEVHVTFREPYRVTNDYLVPSWAG